MNRKKVSIIFIILLIISLVVFLMQISRRYQKVSEYNRYIYLVEELRSVNMHLNSQINRALTVINADFLVKDRNRALELLKKIDTKEYYLIFGEPLKEKIKNIKDGFQKKLELIERFKTYNAAIASSVPYLFDLAQIIKKESKPSIVELKKLGVAITDVFKTFIGIKLGKDVLAKDISNVDLLRKKYKTKTMNFLYMNIKETLKNLTLLNQTIDEYRSIQIDKELKNLLRDLEDRFQNDIKLQNIIIMVLLVILLFILITFIFIYLKLIKTYQELLSFRLAVESSDNSIVMTDKDRNIIYVNEAFEKVTGYTKDEAIGKNPRILKSDFLPEGFYNEMNKTLSKGQRWFGEFINKNKFGEIYYEKASITPIILEQKLIGYLAIKLDITKYIEQKKRVDFLAHHDTLTGLPNRRYFEKEIDTVIKKAEKNEKEFAVLFIDLDGFKLINDSLGHDIGDEVLKNISKKIKHNLSFKDSVFRVGGDEFAIILNKVKGHLVVEKISKRLLEIINNPIAIKRYSINISASIGIALYPEDAKDIQSLLKYADIAMYKAKLDGKNRYVFYSRTFSEKLYRDINIEKALKKSIEEKNFYLVYQPKYSLETKEVLSVEALLRWDTKEFRNLSPDIFIPIAEKAGFMKELGEFVFKQACNDYKHLKKLFPNLTLVSVNVSSTQLLDTDISEIFKNIVEKNSEVNYQNIGIEVTETYIMKDIKLSNQILQKMSSFGFKILLDDFGTGYSSMIYLKELPINILKIDKSFIENVCYDENDHKIVEAIIAMAKSFNFVIVAEGIETKEQENLLRELGVDLAQGYLFCKPKRLEEF